MSVATVRGGVPHVFRAAIDTAGRVHALPSFALYLIIRVTGAACRMYFTKADFDANVNYILVPVPSAGTPHGEWAGPAEIGDVWLKADTGTSNVELVAFQRRG